MKGGNTAHFPLYVLHKLGQLAAWMKACIKVLGDIPRIILPPTPRWPSQGFATLDEARHWVRRFVSWYNHEHRHSRIKFVTPAQRHRGEDEAILKKRHNVYELAKSNMPARWSGKTRNWNPVGAVTLNPEKGKINKVA